MTDTFTLEIRGLAELQAAFTRLGRDLETELAPALEDALRYLWQQLPSYPAKPQPGEASRHWTPKQRAWFFAALRAGEVQTPYKRRLAGGLGGSLSTEVRSQAEQLTGLMGPSMPYAPHVIGLDQQSSLHAGRWWTLEEEVEKNLPGAVARLEQAVAQMIARL